MRQVNRKKKVSIEAIQVVSNCLQYHATPRASMKRKSFWSENCFLSDSLCRDNWIKRGEKKNCASNDPRCSNQSPVVWCKSGNFNFFFVSPETSLLSTEASSSHDKIRNKKWDNKRRLWCRAAGESLRKVTHNYIAQCKPTFNSFHLQRRCLRC